MNVNPIKTRKNTQECVFFGSGGDSRDRTGDLLNAIQALYQLSYTPKPFQLLYSIICR